MLKHSLPWIGRIYRQRNEARRQWSAHEGTGRVAQAERDEARRELSLRERTVRVAEAERDEARRQLSLHERTPRVAETKHHNDSFGQRTIIGSKEDDLYSPRRFAFSDRVLQNKKGDEAKRIFAEHCRYISLELFSYCNRKCVFCPNNFLERDGDNHVMPETVMQIILDNLSEIDYCGSIDFTRYNENLSHPEIFVPAVERFRRALPKARLHTNTNGDYVTLPYLYALSYAGLDSVRIQSYLNGRMLGNLGKKQEHAIKRLERLGLKYELSKDGNERHFIYESKIGYMKIYYEGVDYTGAAFDRGGALPSNREERSEMCTIPMREMYINYDGTVSPCCNITRDIHGDEYTFGKIGAGADLFDVFFDARMIEFRKSLLNLLPKGGACAKCNFVIAEDRSEKLPDFALDAVRVEAPA